jgi:hypothetical protein
MFLSECLPDERESARSALLPKVREEQRARGSPPNNMALRFKCGRPKVLGGGSGFSS